jgi:plasmid stabilization system protein ParE
MVVRHYLLFYRIHERRGVVEISQIRHGARRLLG